MVGKHIEDIMHVCNYKCYERMMIREASWKANRMTWSSLFKVSMPPHNHEVSLGTRPVDIEQCSRKMTTDSSSSCLW